MPDFPIVDSHVHLYDVDRLRYGWLANHPALNRTNLLPEFDAARGSVAVDGIVFVEVWADAGLHVAEAEFVQNLAASDSRVRGLVCRAPVERGDAVEEDLDALSRFAALRGIRRLIEVEHDPSICLEPGFIEGVKRVGRRGLTFDLCIKHWAMTYAIELVRRCPDVNFVLDHIGKPGIRHHLREPWWSQIAELAHMPNVVCKLSGVITEADHAHWSRADITPYVERAISQFGFDRVMFGSDWTVSELTHRYPDWVSILDEITAGCTDDERRRLFRENAMRVYRLESA